MRTYARTGRARTVLGHKLYEYENNYWQDDSGKTFHIVGEKLYEEREPGKWYWLRSDKDPERKFGAANVTGEGW